MKERDWKCIADRTRDVLEPTKYVRSDQIRSDDLGSKVSTVQSSGEQSTEASSNMIWYSPHTSRGPFVLS